jgi:hypothetical protein
VRVRLRQDLRQQIRPIVARPHPRERQQGGPQLPRQDRVTAVGLVRVPQPHRQLPHLGLGVEVLRIRPLSGGHIYRSHRGGRQVPAEVMISRGVWRTLAGWSCQPGELSRIGPVTAGVTRDLTLAAAADATCEWKVIVVGRSGRAVAVAKVRRLRAGRRARSRDSASIAASGNGDVGVVGRITLTIPVGLLHPAVSPDETEPAGSGPLAAVLAAALRAGEKAFSARRSRTAAGGCSHEEASPGYRVPDPMRALVEARDRTCGFPTCRQPAWRCEQDHTIAHRLGGPTCPCNLSPECTRHHHLKHLPSWRLDQPRPGVLTWTTPARLTHTVTSGPYPA